MGRGLTSAKADLAKLRIMNQLGLPYNLDLMFGTPAQTEVSWVDTLTRIAGEISPPEITIYQYVNAYGSETRKWIAQGKITRPDFNMRRKMYYQALGLLEAVGYKQTSTYSFAKDQTTQDRDLLSYGTDFLGLGPRTYSRVGPHLFINDARTSDFLSKGTMADFVGIRVPLQVMTLLDRIFGSFASKSRAVGAEGGLVDLRNLKSEAVAQIYGILYYITNQPRLSRIHTR